MHELRLATKSMRSSFSDNMNMNIRGRFYSRGSSRKWTPSRREKGDASNPYWSWLLMGMSKYRVCMGVETGFCDDGHKKIDPSSYESVR